MSRMVPDWTDGELKVKIPVTHDGYDGERKLYRELRKLPDDWVVLYDRTLSDGHGANQIDFLVFVPGKGVVNVDAKGGPADPGVGYHIVAGSVYLGDERKDVFSQARGAINRFSERVYQLLRIPKSINGALNLWGSFGSLVVFTNKDLIIPSEHEASYLGATDLYTPGKLKEAIEGQLELHPEGHQPFRRYMRQILERWTIDDEGRYVSRQFQEGDEESAQGLNVPQSEIFYRIQSAASEGQIFHVMGAAGTGKTVIACGLARDFSAEGKSVLYVCYNEFLAKQVSKDPRNNNIRVVNFHRIGELIGERNLTVWNDGVFDRIATYARVRDELYSGRRLPKFDVLIVDEAQDLCQDQGRNEIAVLLPLLKRSRRIIVFSDKGQSLYSLDWDLDVNALGGQNVSAIEHVLYMNFRNRSKVFDEFKHYNVTENDDKLSCYRIGGVVKAMTSLGLTEVLEELVREGRRPRDIVVLGVQWNDLPETKTFTLGDMHIHLKRNRRPDGTRDDRVIDDWLSVDSPKSGFVLVTTEKQFKGLESNVVIFISNHASEQQKYVAESRAKYELYIVSKC